MTTTLIVLTICCVLSLLFILVIPPFSRTKLFMRFLPRDIRDAARAHPNPPVWKQLVGFALTALAAFGYLAAIVFLGADALRRGGGFWEIFGRYMVFLYGYKVFDILVQDQYIVIRKKYYLRFFPETRDCESWNDYSFNKQNQMKRLIAFPFVCALMAWITCMIGGTP